MSSIPPIASPTPRQVLTIPRSDRWPVCHRLQELEIPCGCSEAGELWVEVNSPTAALQLRSVLQLLTSSRQDLVGWLNHCWRQSC